MKAIDEKAYYANYPGVLERLIAKPTVNVLIACLADDTTVVLGWIAFEPARSLGHFAFVKRPWRRQGVLRLLLSQIPTIKQVSHLTKPGNSIRIKNNWSFNPFTL
jgi:hypothetical protein